MSISLQDVMNGNDGDSQSTKGGTETLPQPNCSSVGVGNGLVNVDNKPRWVSNNNQVLISSPVFDTIHLSLNDLLNTFKYANITFLNGLDRKIPIIELVALIQDKQNIFTLGA